MASKILRTSCT